MPKLLSFLADEMVTPADIAKTAEFLSTKSDRWIMLASLVILLVFCWMVIRYLINDREQARKDHAAQIDKAYMLVENARTENSATMKEMYIEQTKLAAQVLVALQENNQLLTRMNLVLDHGPVSR